MFYIVNPKKDKIVELKSIKIEKDNHSSLYRYMDKNERKKEDASLKYNLIINDNFIPYARYKTYEKAKQILEDIINEVNNKSNYIYELEDEE